MYDARAFCVGRVACIWFAGRHWNAEARQGETFDVRCVGGLRMRMDCECRPMLGTYSQSCVPCVCVCRNSSAALASYWAGVSSFDAADAADNVTMRTRTSFAAVANVCGPISEKTHSKRIRSTTCLWVRSAQSARNWSIHRECVHQRYIPPFVHKLWHNHSDRPAAFTIPKMTAPIRT